MSLFGEVEVVGRPDLENVRRLDLLPVGMCRKMSRYGIAVDVEYLREFSVELGKEMKELERDIASFIPADKLDLFSHQSAEIEDEQGTADLNANSALQIRILLFDLLGVGNGRNLKLTAEGKASTGKKQLELCRDDHPVVQKVLHYRERSKLKSAFADALPQKARLHPKGYCSLCEEVHVESTWRVHTEWLMTRTETGRLASKNPNLQQIPARSKLGGRIRQAFLASPGCRLVSSDFSQIELRDLAHCANATSMIEAYREDKDIHSYTACRVFGLDEGHYAMLQWLKDAGSFTEEQARDWSNFSLYNRLPCKNINFMIVYGATAVGLQAQLALSGLFWSEEQCNAFIDKWFGLYPEVEAYMELQHRRARRYGYIWDVFGRVRRVPEVYSTHSWIKSAGLRQAGNMPIQSASAGQTKLVMGELDQDFEMLEGAGVKVWPLLTIHDQLLVEAEESIAEEIGDLMVARFSGVMEDKETGENSWRTPIKSDKEVLTRWQKG
jgi:DNA polymerase-1